jgi:hypothetical protein
MLGICKGGVIRFFIERHPIALEMENIPFIFVARDLSDFCFVGAEIEGLLYFEVLYSSCV